jgi:hypothetical protein
MNQVLLSIIVFGLLLLFIFSPFAALAGLMLVMIVATLFYGLGNIFRAIIGSSKDADSKS